MEYGSIKDWSSLCVDGPGYLLSNGLLTKVHYGTYQATDKQRKISGDVVSSKSSTVTSFGEYLAC